MLCTTKKSRQQKASFVSTSPQCDTHLSVVVRFSLPSSNRLAQPHHLGLRPCRQRTRFEARPLLESTPLAGTTFFFRIICLPGMSPTFRRQRAQAGITNNGFVQIADRSVNGTDGPHHLTQAMHL